MREDKGGIVDCRVFLNGDERIKLEEDLATVLILPKKPLERQKKYAVSIKCTLDGMAFERKWSFTTTEKTYKVRPPHDQ